MKRSSAFTIERPTYRVHPIFASDHAYPHVKIYVDYYPKG
jgi:hypothetical protein